MPTDHAPILLSLIRTSDGINAWISDVIEDGQEYNVVPRKLKDLAHATYPGRAELLADWDALGEAHEAGAVWTALWRVFWATLSENQDTAPAAMPQQIARPARPLATAAHPRAFRGTKFQPPKPAANALDLHAWMSDDRLIDGFFARHDFARWPVLGPDGKPWPIDKFAGGRPTVAALLAMRGQSVDASFPLIFRRHFLWALRDCPASQRIAWLRLWRALGAPSQAALLPILARLCALDAAAHEWAGMAISLLPARQSIFLLCLLKHHTYRLPASQLSGEQLDAFNMLSGDDDNFAAFLDVAFDNLTRGVNIAYTLIGCHLPARDGRPESLTSHLCVASHADHVPVADIERMLAALGEDGVHWARSAWESCATQPGFARVLTETRWESLSSCVADRWLSLFQVTEWDFEKPASRAAQWKVRLAMFPELQQEMLKLPSDRHLRFVAMQLDYVAGWDDPVTLKTSWPVVLPLQVRLCSPVYPSRATGNGALSSMAIHLCDARLRWLAEIPDHSWLAIEKASRRNNDSTLIRRGLYSLTESSPDFALHALELAPKRLMRSMSLLGCLEYNSRRRFMVNALRTPWFDTDWEAMPALASCERMLALCLEYGVDSPLPRRLREHLEGRCSLSEQQVARHCSVTLARLTSVQLAALEVMAWRHIDAPFNLHDQSTAANHAVRLHASIDGGNKKSLRRFLHGYANGGVHTYLDHPLNSEWYARHPRVDATVWGSDTLHEFTDDGAIRLSIETDPLEILMLGSYVGSCLGLGGLCEYSAVACLVDANKQVVYARDAVGRVVARQLLAIDERERLVCFEVYPQSANAQVLQAFRRFDDALAHSLGLDVYCQVDGDSYEVKTILAIEWWDDGQWREFN